MNGEPAPPLKTHARPAALIGEPFGEGCLKRLRNPAQHPESLITMMPWCPSCEAEPLGHVVPSRVGGVIIPL